MVRTSSEFNSVGHVVEFDVEKNITLTPIGSPFTNPTGKLPAKNVRNLKVLDHALNVLFSTPFTPITWHNFAVQVDWDNNALAVLYSQDSGPLKAVTKAIPNPTHPTGPAGQGDFHFGVLKV